VIWGYDWVPLSVVVSVVVAGDVSVVTVGSIIAGSGVVVSTGVDDV
jgi:hypothetical protein